MAIVEPSPARTDGQHGTEFGQNTGDGQISETIFSVHWRLGAVVAHAGRRQGWEQQWSPSEERPNEATTAQTARLSSPSHAALTAKGVRIVNRRGEESGDYLPVDVTC